MIVAWPCSHDDLAIIDPAAVVFADSVESLSSTCVHSNGLLPVQVKAHDIAGSMKADKQNLRMEELDLLFQTCVFG